MIRFVIGLFLVFILSYLLLSMVEYEGRASMPLYMVMDPVAEANNPELFLSVQSIHQPEAEELDVFKKDYKALWGHLNRFYTSNDFSTGKEYYTENWFKQIITQVPMSMETIIKRSDLKHHIEIQSWSEDGLVCILKDRCHFSYEIQGEKETQIIETEAEIQMALLFQGAHWRIDALRFLNEKYL